MIKTIICALDFGSESESVLKWAINISKTQKASLIILYSYRLTPSANGEDLRILKERIESEAKSQFLKIEQLLLDSNVSAYNFMVEVGFLSDRIQSHALRNNDSLLIMGSDVAKLIQGSDEKGLIFYLEDLRIPTFILPGKSIATKVGDY